jgi:hypothetical protein
VATLIADINTANSNGQSNTINLSASTYNLTTINNFLCCGVRRRAAICRYGPDGAGTTRRRSAVGPVGQRHTGGGVD